MKKKDDNVNTTSHSTSSDWLLWSCRDRIIDIISNILPRITMKTSYKISSDPFQFDPQMV